jgi:hypothetical protein
MKNVVALNLVVLAVLGLAPQAYGNLFSDDFESYLPAPHVEIPSPPFAQTPILGKGGWVASHVNSSTASNNVVRIGWGIAFPNPEPDDPIGMVTDDQTYDHVAVNVGRLQAGDQISVMFDLWATDWFAELWVGGADIVDGTNHVEQALMVQGSGSGASPGHIGYNLFNEEGGAENNHPSGTLTVPDDNAGRVGHWTEVRLTMLDLGGISTLGLDSALVETRNALRTKNGTHDGSWFTVGTFDMHVAGIGGYNATNSDSDIYIGLGGMGANIDNLLVTGPGLVLLNGVTVDEQGATSDTVKLRVRSIPSETVTVQLQDPNSGEPDDFTVTPQQFVLNPFTMDPNDIPLELEFTVTAVDDGLFEPTEQFEIFVTGLGLEPNQPFGLSNSVSVSVLDNDTGAVAITDDGMSVSEEGQTSDSYTLELNISPVSDDVTIDLATDNSQITLDPTQVVFNTGNWNVPATITATAVDDPDGENDPHPVDITHAVTSNDSNFLLATASNVTVLIVDNDCNAAGPFLAADDTGPGGVPDCQVDLFDFNLWALQWLTCSLPNVPSCVTP